MEKENNSDGSDFSENEIPDLNSLKPFEFEPKTTIGDIVSSSSNDEKEGAEYKVKRLVTMSCASAVQNYLLCSSKWVSDLQLYATEKEIYLNGTSKVSASR